MRNNCFLVSNSSRKAFHPWLSVALLCAHFSSRHTDQPVLQSRATPTRAGENRLPPCFLQTCCLLISFNVPRPFSRHTGEKSLLSIFPFCHFGNATSGIPPYVTSLQTTDPVHLISSGTKAIPRTWASLSPCCSSPVAVSFRSSDGCIFKCISYFSESRCLGKRVIPMTQPRTVHAQTYAFAHTLQKGNVHFKSIHR